MLIFDLDDTLIDTIPLYREKIHLFGKKMQSLGFDYYESLENQNKIDLGLIPSMNFDPARFPKSMADTYIFMCKEQQKNVDLSVIKTLTEIGASLYNENAKTFKFCHKVLALLSNHTKYVLTKGGQTLQLQRYLDSGLVEYFKGVFVVDNKTPETFERVCALFGAEKENSVMIGNSLQSDILPALEAGLYGIHVDNGTLNWEGEVEFDTDSNPKYIKVTSLEGVPSALEKIL